jgi:hypothetical protein
MQRATVRAIREASATRPQLQEDMADDDDTTTVSVDLETGEVR